MVKLSNICENKVLVNNSEFIVKDTNEGAQNVPQLPSKDNLNSLIEPSHEIMALFVLRKLILQMHMRSHPVGLDV